MKSSLYMSGFLLGLLAIPTAAAAQNSPPTPPSTKPGKITAKRTGMQRPEIGLNPAAHALMQKYGLSRTDASERIQLQQDVLALSQKLEQSQDAAFTDLWIEHQPVFKIVIGFADAKERIALLQSIEPKLRRYVQIRQMPKNRGQIEQDLDTLIASINRSGVAFTGGYDLPNGRFVIVTENQADAQKIRELIPPTLRGDVQIIQGRVPRKSAGPSYVQPGNYLEGGFRVYNDAGVENCTFGYRVSYGSPARSGIITAGHCKLDGVWSWHGNWVYYDTYYPVAYGETGLYDFVVVDATGLEPATDQAYGVYYEDRNSIPEFPASGYFDVVGTLALSSQKVGYIMCKSGIATGITCGEITSNNAIRLGSAGWVSVSNTSQRDLGARGDSGGPWFMYPGTNTDIYAAGIHAGDKNDSDCVGTGWACTAQYMPIERIDDVGGAMSGNSSIRVVVKKDIVVTGSQ
jgi:hypothetical protein